MAYSMRIVPVTGEPFENIEQVMGEDVVVARHICEDMRWTGMTPEGSAVASIGLLLDGNPIDTFDGTAWTSGTPVPPRAPPGRRAG